MSMIPETTANFEAVRTHIEVVVNRDDDRTSHTTHIDFEGPTSDDELRVLIQRAANGAKAAFDTAEVAD